MQLASAMTPVVIATIIATMMTITMITMAAMMIVAVIARPIIVTARKAGDSD